MARVAVYAIGGNALASPSGEVDGESERVLAHVMSDVVDLLEAGWGVVSDPRQWSTSRAFDGIGFG